MKIETDRLLLRPRTSADRDASLRMQRDTEMMHYLGRGQPLPDEYFEQALERQARNLAGRGFAMVGMELKETGELMGVAGLQPLSATGEIEVGWWVWKEYWNRGFATEAAAACLEHAFGPFGLSRIVAITDPDNTPSIRVMEKLGMRYEGRRIARELEPRYPAVKVLYYAIER